ncbi:MAG: hypothetical protein KDL87_08315, partial [Verrucomicrobiae bacterium]|nr:hypothetical protein [Verrucomicrobiae bacterium]
NVQFGATVGAQSSHVIFYRGLVYYGQCFGIVNSYLNKVVVTGNASDNGLDGSDGPVNGIALNTGASSTIEASSNSGIATTVPNRKRLANSSWHGKLSGRYPVKRFHGGGVVHFVGEPDFDILLIDIDVQGADVSVTPVSSRSSDPLFERVGHRVPMKVFGSQVSTQITG